MLSNQRVFNSYIDGFNLYKGALQNRPDLKWLDLIDLSKNYRPGWQLNRVYYFTAPIRPLFQGDEGPQRQATYLRVLRNQGIEIVYGHFRRDERWMRAASNRRLDFTAPAMPSQVGLTQRALNRAWKDSDGGGLKTKVFKLEEKGSDVNLASFLLRDVYALGLSGALVITGDSDLATPITLAKDQGADIRVVVPRRGQVSSKLRAAASSLIELHPNDLSNLQLEDVFITPKGGNIVRPNKWK